VLYCATRFLQKHKARNRKRELVTEDNATQEAVLSDMSKTNHLLRKVFAIVVHIVKVFLTFLYVNAAWVFFRSESIAQALGLFRRMFTGDIALPQKAICDAFNLDEFWYVMKILHLTDFSFSNYILMIVFTIVIVLVTFFGKNVQEMAKVWRQSLVSAVMLAVIFIWCVVSLSGVSTFLYFNF